MAAIRSVGGLRRKPPSRKPRKRILVVSEGEKTEGLYVSLFRQRLRAANVAIDLVGKECGSDPMSVVEHAKAVFDRGRDYDICFCLIDRDTHPQDKFKRAQEIANGVNLRSKNRDFHFIPSYPCIEFWFILHFEYWRAPFSAKRNKSPADCVIDVLKRHLPNYSKSSTVEMSKLVSLTRVAITNSERALQDAEATGELNPSTQMHLLIKQIMREAGSL